MKFTREMSFFKGSMRKKQGNIDSFPQTAVVFKFLLVHCSGQVLAKLESSLVFSLRLGVLRE
jgi:hypothetical protein